MMLAFLIDPIQQRGCRLFQAAVTAAKSKTRFWRKLRTRFDLCPWPTTMRGGGNCCILPAVPAFDTWERSQAFLAALPGAPSAPRPAEASTSSWGLIAAEVEALP